MSKVSKKYISQVKKHLKCSYKLRKEFLETLVPEIEDFDLSNPDAGYSDYIEKFGKPKHTAAEFMSELGVKVRWSRWIFWPAMIVCVVVGAFVMWLTIYTIQTIWLEAKRNAESSVVDITSSQPVQNNDMNLCL